MQFWKFAIMDEGKEALLGLARSSGLDNPSYEFDGEGHVISYDVTPEPTEWDIFPETYRSSVRYADPMVMCRHLMFLAIAKKQGF